MNVNPLVLHRAGTLMVLLLIGLTAILFIAGSDYSWLGMGATGLALLAWALVDLEFGSRRRAVMAALGVAFSLFGLLPWFDLLSAHAA